MLRRFCLLVCLLAAATLYAQQRPCLPPGAFTFTPPEVVFPGDEIRIGVTLADDLAGEEAVLLRIEGVEQAVALDGGRGYLTYTVGTQRSIGIGGDGWEQSLELPLVRFPWWLSLLPPLISILLALLFREVVLSLVLGVFSGAAVLAIYETGSWTGIFRGLLAVVDTYVVEALSDSDHVSIIVFSMLIGGMVAIISRNGGMQGIVDYISRYARTPRSAQFATWLLGIVIFFDDYANTLVVGNTMRPMTDRLRISREKLSYLVDSTAAPVSALAFITTWIGAELGYIEDGIAGLAAFPEGQSPYAIFLASLGYSFYPILTLIFMLLLIAMGRDYGPMLTAERRARISGAVSNDADTSEAETELRHFRPLEDISVRAHRAVLPILTLVLGVIAGLLATGWSSDTWTDPGLGFVQRLSQTIGNANSYAALLWASFGAVAMALALSVGGGILSLGKGIETMLQGFKAMLPALLVLTLAWALQGITSDMHTAGFLTDLLGDSLAPGWLPVLTFLLASLVSFSTGTSWGTMAILYPLLIPLAWQVSRSTGLPTEEALAILHNVVASVLAGSVLGDHCSPISDTTILSSLASSCNHIDHVRTQLPYALSVGAIAIVAGTLPTGFGLPVWMGYLLAVGMMYGVIRFWGKSPEAG
ncbi:MAG: Na+/H+ antiporter NhaC family protein [Bacteroidia bacterium]